MVVVVVLVGGGIRVGAGVAVAVAAVAAATAGAVPLALAVAEAVAVVRGRGGEEDFISRSLVRPPQNATQVPLKAEAWVSLCYLSSEHVFDLWMVLRRVTGRHAARPVSCKNGVTVSGAGMNEQAHVHQFV